MEQKRGLSPTLGVRGDAVGRLGEGATLRPVHDVVEIHLLRADIADLHPVVVLMLIAEDDAGVTGGGADGELEIGEQLRRADVLTYRHRDKFSARLARKHRVEKGVPGIGASHSLSDSSPPPRRHCL